MLAQNLKWAFLTILTCIEKSEEQRDKKNDWIDGNDDTNENQN